MTVDERDEVKVPAEWRGIFEAAANWHPDWQQSPNGRGWIVRPGSPVRDAETLLKAYDQHLVYIADRLAGTPITHETSMFRCALIVFSAFYMSTSAIIRSSTTKLLLYNVGFFMFIGASLFVTWAVVSALWDRWL